MFRLSSSNPGRSFADREKMMIGFVVAALAIAAVVLGMYFTGGDKGGAMNDGNLLVECVDPACGNTWHMSKDEINADVMALPMEQRAQMAGGIRMECPKCKNPKRTGVVGFKCPGCGGDIVSPVIKSQTAQELGFRVPRYRGPVACPNCGIEDVDKYWAENKGKKRK